MNFTLGNDEALHILASVVTIALAFSVFDLGLFPLMLLTVGTGFVLHELAHKFVAQHYGAHAFYRAWTTGLFLAVALAVATNGGFIFAAPGAVYVFGRHLTHAQNAKISLAGPATNIVLALVFVFLMAVPGLAVIGYQGAYVNLFLAMFNMLPVFVLDGAKVFAWSPAIWGVFMAVAAIMFFGIRFTF